MPITKTDLTDLINFRVGGSGKQDWFRPNLEKGQQSKKYRIRVLPPAEGETVPFYSTNIHYFRIIDEEGNRQDLSGVCPSVNNQPCPACARFWKLRGIVEKDVKKALSDLNAATRIYCNMIDRGEEEPAVKVWSMSYNVGTDIVDNFQAYAGSGKDLSDPSKGYDFVISLKARGASFNYGSVARVPTASAINLPGWSDQLHDLHDMAHQRELSPDDIFAVLPAVLGPFHEAVEDIYQRVQKGSSHGTQKETPKQDDLTEMSAIGLRVILRELGEITSGNKAALIRRIKKSRELEGLGERV